MNDVKIAGSGVLNGGSYNNITTAGSAKFTSHIKANKISTAGSAKFLGIVDAEEISIAGSAKFDSDVYANRISIAGSSKVSNFISAKTIKVSGALTAVDLKGEDVIIKSNSSKIKDILANKVYIGIDKKKKFFRNEIEVIEAKTIEINHTNVKKVTGEDVIIGVNSNVELVLYSKSITINKKAIVKEKIKNIF